MKKRISISLMMGLVLMVIFLTLAGCSSSQPKATSNPPAGDGQAANKEVAKTPYPEKDIEFIVPTAPGGGYDAFARAIMPYVAKHLPNKVNIVIKNIEGSGNTLGFTSLYKAKPDGYTIGELGLPGMVADQVLGRAQYDVNKYTWFGAFGSEPYLLAVNKDRPYRTVSDLQQASTKLKLSTVGLSSTAGLSAAIAGEALGIGWDLIPHKGGADSVLSAARGDTDGVQHIYSTMKSFIDTGDLIPLVVYSTERLPELPDVPTIVEAGYPELAQVARVNWVMAGPPEMPQEIADILSEALAKAMQEPELQAWAKEAGRPLKYDTREAVEEMAKGSLDGYGKYKHIFEKYIQ